MKFTRREIFKDARVVVEVLARTSERVLYKYRYDGVSKIGCVSNKFFEAEYAKV